MTIMFRHEVCIATSLWIFLAVHTNRMSCLYTYMLHLIHDLKSVGLGTREVCRSGNETTIECARAEQAITCGQRTMLDIKIYK